MKARLINIGDQRFNGEVEFGESVGYLQDKIREHLPPSPKTFSLHLATNEGSKRALIIVNGFKKSGEVVLLEGKFAIKEKHMIMQDLEIERDEPPKYPECEKWAKIHDQAVTITEFITWLSGQGIFLAETHCTNPQSKPELRLYTYIPIGTSLQNLIYRCFKIDPAKLEQERRAMLDEAREANER